MNGIFSGVPKQKTGGIKHDGKRITENHLLHDRRQ
jgi:hypothetical protein